MSEKEKPSAETPKPTPPRDPAPTEPVAELQRTLDSTSRPVPIVTKTKGPKK